MDPILETIRRYAMHALFQHNIQTTQSEAPCITFEGGDATLIMNIYQHNDEILVWGRCDSRNETHEYEIGYFHDLPNIVNWEVIEISHEGWGIVDNILFFEPFISLLEDAIMEFNLVKWVQD